MIQIPIERRRETIPDGYVKVVRCSECKYSKKISQSQLSPDYYCEHIFDEFEPDPVLVNENDFCSRGRRKD